MPAQKFAEMMHGQFLMIWWTAIIKTIKGWYDCK